MPEGEMVQRDRFAPFTHLHVLLVTRRSTKRVRHKCSAPWASHDSNKQFKRIIGASGVANPFSESVYEFTK